MPLAQAQRLLGKPGLVKLVFVANRGGPGATERVIASLRPTLSRLGLEADNSKQDALKTADEQGAAFMSLFTTFGSFSIAAGILLIFLIFVMLAAERRTELGIARAVGTRRAHLVQMFVYEGLAYDLLAAAAGALLGVAIAYAMVLGIASAFSATADVTVGFSVRLTSVVIAYAIGVLLTLGVVAFSARRVSRMNIVSAIRNLPEPPTSARRSRRVLGAIGLTLGSPAARTPELSSSDGIVLGFGVLFLVLGLDADRARSGSERPGRLHRGRAGAGRVVRPADEPVAARRSEDELLDVHPLRPRDRRRSELGAHVQRGRGERCPDRDLRAQPPARAGPQAVARVSAREPVPHRRHARDVHARRLHPRDRRGHHGLVRQRHQRHRDVRRRIRRPRDHRAGKPGRRSAHSARRSARRPRR